MGANQSNWHKKEKAPQNKECQTPNCSNKAEKKYKFPDADNLGFAHLCLECWRKMNDKIAN